MSVTTVIVTGAAAGVGRDLVGILLDNGKKVIGCDIDEQGLDALSDSHDGRPLMTHACDVGVRESCEQFMDRTLTDFPDVNGLVNNAGLYLGQPVWDYDDDTIDRVIAVNIKGPVWLSRRFANHLMEQNRRGAIVNVASVAGEVGSSDALYGTVKAGVIGLTKSNAMNFAPLIRVNAVSPGLIAHTAISERIPEYRYKEYKRQELLDGDIMPKDIAQVCSYALSDNAKTLTGSVLRADNGCYPR